MRSSPFARKKLHGRLPLIAGAGSNNTAHAVELSKAAAEAGADALLHVTPYYNKTSQTGLYLHFKACAEATRLPVILYNVPTRTGMNILPETYLKLSRISNIVAAKEASGNFSQMAKISALCGDDLTLYSGNDDQITSALAIGAKGVISVLANIVPEATHDICQSYFDGDSARSDTLQLTYLELIENLFRDVNPIPVKQAMKDMGFEVGVPAALVRYGRGSGGTASRLYGAVWLGTAGQTDWYGDGQTGTGHPFVAEEPLKSCILMES